MAENICREYLNKEKCETYKELKCYEIMLTCTGRRLPYTKSSKYRR